MSARPGHLPFVVDVVEEESATRGNGNHGRAPRKIGLAGESLTEFFLWQFCDNVTRAAEGSPYDILAEYQGQILKIQVKTSRYRLHGHAQKAYRYEFVRKSQLGTLHVRKVRNRRFLDGECDIFALVAYELRRVVFILANHNRKVLTYDRQSFDIDEIERISFELSVKRLIGTCRAI